MISLVVKIIHSFFVGKIFSIFSIFSIFHQIFYNVELTHSKEWKNETILALYFW